MSDLMPEVQTHWSDNAHQCLNGFLSAYNGTKQGYVIEQARLRAIQRGRVQVNVKDVKYAIQLEKDKYVLRDSASQATPQLSDKAAKGIECAFCGSTQLRELDGHGMEGWFGCEDCQCGYATPEDAARLITAMINKSKERRSATL